jgi:hypothetical protein
MIGEAPDARKNASIAEDWHYSGATVAGWRFLLIVNSGTRPATILKQRSAPCIFTGKSFLSHSLSFSIWD